MRLKELFGQVRNEKSERGAALMLALFTTTLLMVIATQIMYESSVEFVVSTQAVNQVKAYWAARSGVEMSLLRIHIFKQAQALGGSMIPDPTMLDEIWRQPFLWPPPVPASTSTVDTDEIKKAVKASDLTVLKMSYFTTIEAEGAKVDINDLGSPSKIMANAARNQLLQLFLQKMESDEDFQRRHRGFEFEKVVNNIADWVDPDGEGRNGGGERDLYSDRGSNTKFLPPNQPFRTVQELHMVAEVTDEIYDLLVPSITLYGGKGINVNQAPKETLRAFGPAFTEERITRIIADRSDPKRGPFKDEKDFLGYLNGIGISGNPFQIDEAKTPLVFEPETNFRIRSTGKVGQAQSDITAVVYDVEKIRERLEKALVEQATKGAGTGTGAPGSVAGGGPAVDAAGNPIPPKPEEKPAAAAPPPLRRPKIVYWNEE